MTWVDQPNECLSCSISLCYRPLQHSAPKHTFHLLPWPLTFPHQLDNYQNVSTSVSERVRELMSLAHFITEEARLREQGLVHRLMSTGTGTSIQIWGLAFMLSIPKSCKINLGASSMHLAPLSTWISFCLFGIGR